MFIVINFLLPANCLTAGRVQLQPSGEMVLHLLRAFHLPLSSLYAAMLHPEEALFH